MSLHQPKFKVGNVISYSNSYMIIRDIKGDKYLTYWPRLDELTWYFCHTINQVCKLEAETENEWKARRL